jgi:hypothetical protein
MHNKLSIYKQNLNYHLTYNNLDKITKYIYKLNKLNHKQQGGVNNLAVYTFKHKDIMFIPYEEYEKHKDEFIYVPEKQLLELVEKNVDALENAMKEYDSSGKCLYHVSRDPIEKVVDTIQEKDSWLGNSVYHNPLGLWFSCGDEWMKYSKKYDLSSWNMNTYLYEIKISDDVLKITNLEELKEFINKYKNTGDELTFDNVINWGQVKIEYDGLLICPYLGNEIWGERANEIGLRGDKQLINDYIVKAVGDKWKDNLYFMAEWYRHWETATGVIWNGKGVIELNLVKKMDTFEILEKEKDDDSDNDSSYSSIL